MDTRILYLIWLCFILKAHAQCTFQSPFASSTWRDNTRGTVTFGTTTMTGWSITVLSQTVSQWQCLDHSNATTLVLRSQSTISYSSTTIYVYLCMQLTKISDYSYYYYQQHAQEGNAAYERLKFSTSATLTLAETCDSAVTVPTLEFHVLVLQGSESLAALTCGDNLLSTSDYSYNDGTTTACTSTVDRWDVCSDTTKMTFNYTTCSQQIAFSAGGRLTCVATITYNGYDCSVAYNEDSSVDGTTTKQFSCICSSGTSASVAPGNCTAVQSPTALPTAADGTTVVGHLLTYGTQFAYCGPATAESSSGGTNVGLIAGAVVGVLVVVVLVGIGIYCYLRYRKNKVDEVEKPMLTNGALVAHTETIRETASSKPIRRERTALSSTTREKSDLDKSLIQRNATMTSIGLSMKREKSNITQVEPVEKEEEKVDGTTLKGIKFTFLPCFKKTGESGQKDTGKAKGGPLAVLPCFKKKEEHVPVEEPVKVEEPIIPEKKPTSKEKTKPAKGKGGAKKAAAKGKPKGGSAAKGKKSKGTQKAKTEEMVVTDVEDDETAEPVKREKTDLLGNQVPQATSTPIPKPKTSKKSPQMSKRQVSHISEKQTPDLTTNGAVTHTTPVVANGKTSEANPKSKDWTFLQCCFGNRSSVPQGTEAVEEVPEEPKEHTFAPKKAKPTPKGKGAGKKAAPKKGGKTGTGKGTKKDTKSSKSEKTVSKSADNSPPKDDVEEIKLERAKTMPERQREKTTLSITDADKVKVDVYIPDENTPITLKDTVTKVKEENGELHPREKAKSSLGLARPASSTSRASSIRSKKEQAAKSPKKEKKGGEKSGKGKKDKKEKKAPAKKKKK